MTSTKTTGQCTPCITTVMCLGTVPFPRENHSLQLMQQDVPSSPRDSRGRVTGYPCRLHAVGNGDSARRGGLGTVSSARSSHGEQNGGVGQKRCSGVGDE